MLVVTSGSAVMICSGRPMLASPLYLRSPSARDRLRLPLIRPCAVTQPPALLMRASSPGRPHPVVASVASDAHVTGAAARPIAAFEVVTASDSDATIGEAR